MTHLATAKELFADVLAALAPPAAESARRAAFGLVTAALRRVSELDDSDFELVARGRGLLLNRLRDVRLTASLALVALCEEEIRR